MVHVIEYLPSKHEAVNLITSTEIKNINTQKSILDPDISNGVSVSYKIYLII
jgi:hypothetical protein